MNLHIAITVLILCSGAYVSLAQAVPKGLEEQAATWMTANQKKLYAQYKDEICPTLPPRNEKLLATLPAKVWTGAEALADVHRMETKLKRLAQPSVISFVQQQIAKRGDNITLLAQDAVASWYNGASVPGLLLAMHVIQQQPKEGLYWNNLAAMLHGVGQHHKAIPILTYVDQHFPQHVFVKNNLGQAYLGLGDIARAERYLQAALQLDSTNNEANHSMGMIFLGRGQVVQAQRCFVKALKTTYVPSTVVLLEATGYNLDESDELYEAYKSEVPNSVKAPVIGSMKQLKLPLKPLSTSNVEVARKEIQAFMEVMMAEGSYWGSKSTTQSAAEKQQGIHGSVSPYFDKVNRILIPGLHRKEFPPEYLTPPDVDIAVEEEKWKQYYKKRKEIQEECQAEMKALTDNPHHTLEQWQALSTRHCHQLTDFDSKFLSEENRAKQEVAEKYKKRWEAYLTELLKMCSLDPFSFRSDAETAISQYYATMVGLNGNVLYIEPCKPQMVDDKAAAILLSRELALECPAGKLNIPLGVASISLDCSKIEIEGQIGALVGSWEKEFATGRSTLAIGPGISIGKGSFEASAKAVVYISFDKNNEIADVGYKTEAGLKAPIMSGDIKIETQCGIISGYSGAATGFGTTLYF